MTTYTARMKVSLVPVGQRADDRLIDAVDRKASHEDIVALIHASPELPRAYCTGIGTILHYRVVQNDTELARLLMHNGADPTMRTSVRNHALSIRNPLPPNELLRDGLSPLDAAALMDNFGFLRLLCEPPFNRMVSVADFECAAEVAESQGRSSIRELLKVFEASLEKEQ